MQMEFVKVKKRVKCSTNLAVVVICFEMERALLFLNGLFLGFWSSNIFNFISNNFIIRKLSLICTSNINKRLLNNTVCGSSYLSTSKTFSIEFWFLNLCTTPLQISRISLKTVRWGRIGVFLDGKAGPCMGLCMVWCMVITPPPHYHHITTPCT